jgi:prepilin-type N-terminal cleavage/methylation domain-containing protein
MSVRKAVEAAKRAGCWDASLRFGPEAVMLTKSKRAFTLVEILTVVVILAITSAIIIPQISSRDDLKAASAARVLMADLIWAQNRAISSQQKQYVIFGTNTYTLWYKDSALVMHESTNPITQSTYTTTFKVPGTPLADVEITGTPTFEGKTGLCFDEMGTPYGYDGTAETSMTSTGTIQVKCGENVLTISIEGYTGEATVQ